LRSGIVTVVCDLLSHLSCIYEESFESLADYFLSSLLKVVIITKKAMSDPPHICILNMIQSSHFNKGITEITENLINSKK
jgi:hypothetical protein